MSYKIVVAGGLVGRRRGQKVFSGSKRVMKVDRNNGISPSRLLAQSATTIHTMANKGCESKGSKWRRPTKTPLPLLAQTPALLVLFLAAKEVVATVAGNSSRTLPPPSLITSATLLDRLSCVPRSYTTALLPGSRFTTYEGGRSYP